MSNFEFNKIFAAILIAGIAAYLTAFIGDHLVHSRHLEKDAVFVEGAALEGGAGPAKPKGPDPVMHLIATADIARGEKLSKACAACHSFDNGGVNKIGPNLWGVVNADKGHHAGFAYSDAMLAKGGTWSYASLNKFLWKPKAYVEGTKMNYLGIKKPGDRAAMIAWLRTLSSSPAALPSDAEIAAEAAELAPPEEEQTAEMDATENMDVTEEAPAAAENAEEAVSSEEEEAAHTEDAPAEEKSH